MSTIQATLTGAQAIDRALRIIANNGQNAPTSLHDAVAAGEKPMMKRVACVTHDCPTCPFARDNGSC